MFKVKRNLLSLGRHSEQSEGSCASRWVSLTLFEMTTLTLFLCCFFLNNAIAQNQTFRSYWHPTYLGQRLDYCSIDKKDCGKKIADCYCRRLGYEKAKAYAKAPNIGLTRYFGTKMGCTGWTCNGFMKIDCQRKVSHKPPRLHHYTEKKFVYPRFNNYRVDWCYDKNKDCGRRAANSFCRRMGYMHARNFQSAKGAFATQTINSQDLCFGSRCRSFKSIQCTR